MNADSMVKARLAQYAYSEMKGCGYKAMLALAFIIRNRVRAGWGGDWNACINVAPRFSPYEPRPIESLPLTDREMQRLLVDIDDVYTGSRADPMTEGGLYYYDTLRTDGKDGKQHEWFTATIMRNPKNHPRVAQVGMVQIYR